MKAILARQSAGPWLLTAPPSFNIARFCIVRVLKTDCEI
jgi:hypothetical protein